MKKFLFIFAAVLMSITYGHAQVKIPGTHVSFDFPNNGWSYLKTINVDANTNVHLYAYTASDVISPAGDTILPNMRILVKRNYNGSAYDLAYERYLQQPFQSLGEYYDGLPTQEGLGYVGAYTNHDEGRDYVFRMIYFKEDSTAFEFRIETTYDTYPIFEKTFEEIAKTVSIDQTKQ